MSPYILAAGFEERDRAEIVALLRAYEAGIGISLCFQDFDAELAGLPGDYAPPGGTFILARAPAEPAHLVGCVAVRPVPARPGLCEMKRLFVQPSARGTGLGRELALAALREARRLGYTHMCLDTLPTMREAQALYKALGFRMTGVANTEPPVLLFERALA